MMPYIMANWKIVLFMIAVFILTAFMGIRSCNEIVQENENDNIEIIDIDPPLPSDYDANCMRIQNKPCPPIR